MKHVALMMRSQEGCISIEIKDKLIDVSILHFQGQQFPVYF